MCENIHRDDQNIVISKQRNDETLFHIGINCANSKQQPQAT